MNRWSRQDRYGNVVYLTEERWQHVLESRPELEPYFNELLETLRTGRRKQDLLIPNEYRYYKRFDELLPDNNHLVAIIIFKTRLDDHGKYVSNPRGEPMSEIKIQSSETTANDGTQVRLVYDQEADSMEIFFAENETATGIELTDYILFRLNKQKRRAVSLTLLHFSILTELTEYGPRSYPLDGLEEVPEDLRLLALRLIISMPVSQFLKLSHFQASPTEKIPFTYVEAQPLMAVA
jgi:hypothetical protein